MNQREKKVLEQVEEAVLVTEPRRGRRAAKDVSLLPHTTDARVIQAIQSFLTDAHHL